jgi:hypothetical protein
MAKEEKVSKRMASFTVDLKKAVYYYLQITKPMHKLSDKEMQILTEILYMYTTEQKNFARESDIWQIIFNKDNRAKIRESMDMPKQVFENYMTKLRKKKVIIDNKVNPKFNPSIAHNCTSYELLFKFNIV